MKSNLDYALAYADIGWMVFPCWQVDDDTRFNPYLNF